MTLRKIAIVGAIVGMCMSGVAVAAAPVRASDSHSAVQALGGTARTGKQSSDSSSIGGSSLIIGLLAIAAVAGGIVAATDNGGSN